MRGRLLVYGRRCHITRAGDKRPTEGRRQSVAAAVLRARRHSCHAAGVQGKVERWREDGRSAAGVVTDISADGGTGKTVQCEAAGIQGAGHHVLVEGGDDQSVGGHPSDGGAAIDEN